MKLTESPWFLAMNSISTNLTPSHLYPTLFLLLSIGLSTGTITIVLGYVIIMILCGTQIFAFSRMWHVPYRKIA